MQERSIAGSWEFRFDDEAAWRPIAVPGCWDALDGSPRDRAGPAWYRTRLLPPELPPGGRAWLRFGAVSYDCEIFVDGRPAGRHRGLWDAFDVEITGLVTPGREAELLLRVEKPAGLTAGWLSAGLPGRFPLRETLSGFLPYVWGQIFGGVWQDVRVAATGRAAIADACVRGDAGGLVAVELALTAPAAVTVELRDPGGALVAVAEGEAAGDGAGGARARLEAMLPAPRPWSPESPALYEARVRVADGDERAVRFGLRTLAAEGAAITLNGRPIYPRMALSWGWYPESLHSNPGPERVRADMLRLKSLGYNGVKLCLWFPPAYYFALADELGMLLWVELPLWLPQPSALLREQLPVEYERLVRQARGHPAVILYSLGCELGGEVGADLLGPLYRMVKGLAGDALVRDNSGSGEAFGGLLDEHADYDDHHFYSDLQFLRGLLDAFAPRWRPPRPWLFGEICDLDTFRDLRRLGPPEGRPWWAQADPARNPQGARGAHDLPLWEERLRAAGLWERGAELERVSAQQAMLHRKWTLELVRSYGEAGGYVVTGEADTPVTTAGMLDDSGQLKFAPAAFRAFNADLVLLAGWGRRRAWVAGGDRPAPWDTWSYPAGARVRPHLIASNYSQAEGPAELAWSVAFAGEPPFAAGQRAVSLPPPGVTRELAVADLTAPAVDSPRQATLRVELRAGPARATNAWPLWVFPADPWGDVAGVALVDPAGRLAGLTAIAPGVRPWPAGEALPPGGLAIATAWTPEVAALVEGGGAAVLLQAGEGPPGPLAAAELPFWREALRLIEPHPAWGDFPHEGWAGLQLYGCATDRALVPPAGDAGAPILRRIDARTMAAHLYAVELRLGAGRAIVSTLRFEGGLGDQPAGIGANTAASYLLRCWVRYLLAR